MPKSIAEVMATIHWLGHDGFRIETEDGRIYIDPYKVDGHGADLILVTHPHHDHADRESIARLRKAGTEVVAPVGCDEAANPTITVKAGDAVSVGAITVEAVPAYNLAAERLRFHPREKGFVGYVLEIDGIRIYHAGDTDRIPEMTDLRADIALLPVSGTYTMDSSQAAEAAIDISPGVAVPMHYGSGIAGTREDAVAFKSMLEGKVEVVILPKEN